MSEVKIESTDGTGRWKNFNTYNWWDVPFPLNDNRPLEVTHTVEVEDE